MFMGPYLRFSMRDLSLLHTTEMMHERICFK